MISDSWFPSLHFSNFLLQGKVPRSRSSTSLELHNVCLPPQKSTLQKLRHRFSEVFFPDDPVHGFKNQSRLRKLILALQIAMMPQIGGDTAAVGGRGGGVCWRSVKECNLRFYDSRTAIDADDASSQDFIFPAFRFLTMLQAALKMGLTVCRTWAFNEGDYNALQLSPGQFDERLFRLETRVNLMVSVDTNRMHMPDHGEKEIEILVSGVGVKVSDIE
ncbi:hypothetical protein L1887_20367 [Cichorium endivia]|nr:hypothetical protein L1887_20367 [Cichorium endivia]